jgi:hypothetical protein
MKTIKILTHEDVDNMYEYQLTNKYLIETSYMGKLSPDTYWASSSDRIELTEDEVDKLSKMDAGEIHKWYYERLRSDLNG